MNVSSSKKTRRNSHIRGLNIQRAIIKNTIKYLILSAGLFLFPQGSQAATCDNPGAPLAADRAVLEALYDFTGGKHWKNNTNWKTGDLGSEGNWYGIQLQDCRVAAVSLTDNSLSGEIPSLDGLGNLKHLDLSSNALSGEIPSLDGLDKLEHLDLFFNELSGEIPSLDGLNELKFIYLGGNALSGEIPNLDGLNKLEFLYLADNALSGEIPSLSGLNKLEILYLSDNTLSGEIPNYLFASESVLRQLDLRCTEIKIPDTEDFRAWQKRENTVFYEGYVNCSRRPKPTPKPEPKPKPEPEPIQLPEPEPTSTSSPIPKPKPASFQTQTPEPKQPESTSTSSPTPKPKPASSQTQTPEPELKNTGGCGLSSR